MPEDRAKGAPSAFPELELDLGPVRPAKKAERADDDEHGDVAIELDAPASKRVDPAPQATSLASNSASGPISMGPPVSVPAPASTDRERGSVASSSTDRERGSVASSSTGPTSTPMGPPPGYVIGPSAAPSGAPMSGATQPSAAAALMARARDAAQDPGAVARNVAEVGNRTSTALVMLGGAILLTLLDVIYSRFTGERFSIGPVKLVWIAAPLALVGAVVLGVRLVKERLE